MLELFGFHAETPVLTQRQRINAVQVLAQRPRRDIVELLVAAGLPGLPAGVIASDLDVLQRSLSADLTMLLNVGLIECEIRSSAILYRADLARVHEIAPGLLDDDFADDGCCRAQWRMASTAPQRDSFR